MMTCFIAREQQEAMAPTMELKVFITAVGVEGGLKERIFLAAAVELPEARAPGDEIQSLGAGLEVLDGLAVDASASESGGILKRQTKVHNIYKGCSRHRTRGQ